MTDGSAKNAGCVLVTGAAGFIGRHVVEALLERGQAIVALQHRRTMPLQIQARCKRVLSGDLRDPGIQQEALRDVQVVCHLSAYVPARFDDSPQEALSCYLVNAQATLELAVAASDRGIRRFIHLSTGNMYAASNRPCIETDSLFPAGYAAGYFASKLAAELYLTHLAKRTGIEVVILRVGTPYGPGEPGQKVIPSFLRLAAQGQALRIANGGGARYNFVYVTDVASCAVMAIEKGPPGIYNVASGEHTSIRELTHAIVELFGEREVPLDIEPATTAAAFPGFPALSIEKARRTWGFAPSSVATGLRKYLASLAEENDFQP
jgi:UDP-glucose 4-epimerase